VAHCKDTLQNVTHVYVDLIRMLNSYLEHFQYVTAYIRIQSNTTKDGTSLKGSMSQGVINI
jgi:hypothetical protein